MVFSSLTFLYLFLPVCVMAYYATKKEGIRNFTLLAFSYLFYAWGEPMWLLLLFFSSVFDYANGLLLPRWHGTWKAKAVLIGSLVVNFGLLGLFKYGGFIYDNISLLVTLPFERPGFTLPIGISFYTFQTVSYTIDVYRRDVTPQRNFVSFMMYVSMFPQLVAGPIVRYQTVQDQMTGRVFKWEQMWSGITRFAFGLFKKTAVANTVGALSGKYLEGQLADLTSPEAWIAIAFFSIQLYFDFSGYSDMAIGLARMFGFELEENFRHPYAAVSVADFYRRWHISLGRFFREYVYIPLGGNRRLQDRNIFIVWALTGLWHGASWNFVIWGMYFGVFMIIEKYMGGVLEKTPRFLRHTYTLILIVFSRSIFYYVDFNQLQEFWGRLFTGPVSVRSGMQLDLANNSFILLLAVLLCVPWDEIISEPGERFRSIWKWLAFPTVLLMMGISTLLLVGDTYNPFIYFRF